LLISAEAYILLKLITQNIFLTHYCKFAADLRNSDLNSETFLRKLNRAHEALSQSDTSNSGGSAQGPSQADSPTSSAAAPNAPHQPPPLIKTLSASFGTKWPYKRTMSAPAQMLPRETKPGKHFF
jgi:protein unc-79